MKYILAVIIFSLSQLCFADSQIDMLTKRIEQLEKQQSDILFESSQSGSHVYSFLKDGLTLGGFFESSYTLLQGPGTKFQATNSTNLLGLNLAAEFSNDLHFVSQFVTGLSIPLQNSHNDPRAAIKRREYSGVGFGAVLTQGFLEYSVNDHTHVQFGFGYVPFGFAAQQREIVLFVRRSGPQILRTTELLSPLWSGFNFRQRFNSGSKVWGYNIYTFTRFEDPKIPGVGGRTWWTSNEERFMTGLSLQTAKYRGEIEEVVGADVKIRFSNFVITSEYARHLSDHMKDPWSAYIEPGYFIYQEEILLYTFVDYSESTLNKTGTLSDPYHKFEFGGGVNWLPTSYTRLRLGLTYNDYVHDRAVVQGQNRDYASVDLSVGVAF